MSQSNIALRYANALIEQARESQKFSAVSDDMELIYSTINGSKELRKILANPIVKVSKKQSILEEIFSSINPETLNFIRFVLRKGREDILLDISIKFIELKDSIEGVAAIIIKSPIQLEENQKLSLINKLENFTGKKIRAEYQIDEALIGGFTVSIKDKVIDASIKHQLENLKKDFLGGALLN